MDFSQLQKELKAKKFKPIYCLHGEEAHHIDKLTKHFEEKLLSEAERSFNQMIFYGKDTDSKTLIDTCSRYPMMAPYQVVILKEAQEMKTLENLLPYAEKPVPTTILVICYKHKRFDGRTKLAKAIKANGILFESKKLYDNQVPDWVENHLIGLGFKVEAGVPELIGEYLGTNLSKIVNEIEKLKINLPKGTTINTAHIQDQIGISKDYNIFELQNALAEKDVSKINRIVQYFASNSRKNPIVMIVGSLSNFFSKVYSAYFLTGSSDMDLAIGLGLNKPRNEYSAAFIVSRYRKAIKKYHMNETEKAISVLKEYDLKSKGVGSVNANEGELLKEMIFKIIN